MKSLDDMKNNPVKNTFADIAGGGNVGGQGEGGWPSVGATGGQGREGGGGAAGGQNRGGSGRGPSWIHCQDEIFLVMFCQMKEQDCFPCQRKENKMI